MIIIAVQTAALTPPASPSGPSVVALLSVSSLPSSSLPAAFPCLCARIKMKDVNCGGSLCALKAYYGGPKRK